MTFNQYEISQQGSVPVELYTFTYQGISLYYTSSEVDILIGAITYTSMQISRTMIQESGEIGKNNMTLTVPANFPVSELFAVAPPDDVVGLTVQRAQYADILAGVSSLAVIWVGRITTVSWPAQHSEITCESIYTSLRLNGLRQVYSINCVYVLYGPQCTVEQTAFQTNLTIDGGESGNVLTASAAADQPDGYYAGGIALWQSTPGYFMKRGIKSHTGDQLTLTYLMPGLTVGTVIQVAPGCDHTFPTCESKFSNSINYGGQPYMPQKNPYGEASVF